MVKDKAKVREISAGKREPKQPHRPDPRRRGPKPIPKSKSATDLKYYTCAEGYYDY